MSRSRTLPEPLPRLTSDEPFGIYVHIPYCITKCHYCDFNSYAVRGDKARVMDEDRYIDAVLQEFSIQVRNGSWSTGICRSIFFGGGTPSLFKPRSIERVLRA